MKIVILGGLGLIGSGVYSILKNLNNLDVYCTFGNVIHKDHEFSKFKNFIPVNFFEKKEINKIFDHNPNLVINCMGITKHVIDNYSTDDIYYVNSEIPQLLDHECNRNKSQFIQISSDCVYDGKDGDYIETDTPNAKDIYGKSKSLGEDLRNSLILRTSTIGYESKTKYGLLEWFLSQNDYCNGFTKAFFSGISSLELGIIIRDQILYNNHLQNDLYNISGEKISKFSLLEKFSVFFNKKIKINPDDKLIIDRSLNSKKFQSKANYKIVPWEDMLKNMLKLHIYA
jgi:dTDP-4-dehydrorhamnose reductase|tara:strand:- start:292 stop:1146 length:855 start_codon:yes stop_codon:yes gene_type:complete